jgi:hypothetical protein
MAQPALRELVDMEEDEAVEHKGGVFSGDGISFAEKAGTLVPPAK